MAYLLLIFFGSVGAHRFYLGATVSAVAQLALCLPGFLTFFITWIPFGIWLLIDLFLVPNLTRDKNVSLIKTLSVE